MTTATGAAIPGWDQLYHGGLLLDAQRQKDLGQFPLGELPWFHEQELRRRVLALAADGSHARADVSEFVAFVLHTICGFPAEGWQRGSQVGSEWSRRTLTGELHKPRHLWRGPHGATLPVFFDTEPRLGIGKSRQTISKVLQWLRAGSERLALLTNGQQWRLVFAGLDFDAFCQWDTDNWLEQGGLSPQFVAFRRLLDRSQWTPPSADAPSPLLAAIQDSRKGQADLSAALGERVREAVEVLVQAHGEQLVEHCASVDPADIYRAAVRVVMRMVVVLFAESRELLPRTNPLYHGAYGLQGLREDLARLHARGTGRLARSWNAWPRVLALFRLVHEGSHHPALPVPAYGGELFAPGAPDAIDGITKALAVFEAACFDAEVLSDRDVHRMLELVTRTEVAIRQGRTSVRVKTAIDFSDLSSEYIGILYEGLLDFELRTAPVGDPIVFLAVGNEPALPMSRLEAMDEKVLKSLFEKLQKADAPGADEEEGDEEAAEDAVDEEEVEGGDEAGEPDAEVAVESDDAEDVDAIPDDVRHQNRSRAEAWARKAVETIGLVKKPRGRLTPEKQLAFDHEVGQRARQLVRRVVLPGEWYLVRWGGTRKGSGTFYTRPGLAVPTVHRALRPLAYVPPAGADGQPDELASPVAWMPKLPEQILALKVCDPACGSGSFLVASLRFLCEALYASLHAHGRIQQDGDRALVHLLGKAGDGEDLGNELLPCRPDDPTFEARLKAVLRRYVVEHCVYGVDLDPLAVELCRLALWIETMDRDLPFTFLDHKLRPGNGLVGTWLDRFRDYPLLAWWRQSSDEKWRGVTHEGDVWSKALKEHRRKVVDEQADVIRSQQLLARAGISDQELQQALTRLRGLYGKLHAVPPSRPDERAKIWRDEVLGDASLQKVKAACDLWTALWFWPLDKLGDAPGPSDLAAPSAAAQAIAAQVARRRDLRFFHWELEFPDVFVGEGAGFDAIVGNPPWEIQKPSSKEFFSDLDPLYRSYGKQDALRRQRELFEKNREDERRWLDHVGSFKDKGNFVRNAADPFGGVPEGGDAPVVALVARRASESESLHARWLAKRGERKGCADVRHPYRHQGSADLNTYKLFVEQAHALLRDGGQMALITPSGLYTDKGSVDLRKLLLDRCSWRWLYGFENRDKVFDIHRSFKFAVTIAQKGGATRAIRAAFMRHDLADWAEAKGVLEYPAERVRAFSPKSLSVLEIRDERDLAVLTKIYANSVLLGDDGPDGWGIRYATEFHMTNDSKLFIPRDKAEAAGYRADQYGRWIGKDGDVLLPLYQGAMVHQHDYAFKGWLSVDGKAPKWTPTSWPEKRIVPKLLVAARDYIGKDRSPFRVGFRDIARGTDQRTMIAAFLPDFPCGNKVPFLACKSLEHALGLVGVLDSFTYDWVQRIRQGSTSLNYFVIEECALAKPAIAAQLTRACQQLGMASTSFAPSWQRVKEGMATAWKMAWAASEHERLRLRCIVDAVVAASLGLTGGDLRQVLEDCDHPLAVVSQKQFRRSLNPRGFWRADKDKDPELRHTVLSLVAFHDLQEHIIVSRGDCHNGIASFLAQNNGEGWMLPETLRLADYGLGHDDRAQHPQPVASRLGPRFLDWQLAQTPEESWAECERHAKAILGEEDFARRFSSPERLVVEANVTTKASVAVTVIKAKAAQGSLFDAPVAKPKSLAEPLPLTISKIRLLNFRNWKDQHWQQGVDLRPITLVLGRNSAGKTSILQPLRMLKQTIESTDAGTHLNLGSSGTESLDLGAFQDVVHGHDKSLELGVGIDVDGVSVDVRFAEIGEKPQVSSLLYQVGGERVELQRAGNAYKLDSARFRLPNWDGEKDVHEPKKDHAPGRGIMLSDAAISRLGPILGKQVRKAMLSVVDAFKRFHYLGPLRPAPKRSNTWSQQDSTTLGSTGSETVQVLIGASKTSERQSMLESVSTWLRRLDLADGIEVTRAGMSLMHEIFVVRGGQRVNLVDVGYGVSQVLPVIVLLHFVPEGSVILCEDPEAHLHPMAQAGLADLLVEVARERRLQVLVETHSEHLFRRLQYLMAEGSVQSSDCALYYVERDQPTASITRLQVDEFGRVANWPTMLFGDSVGETERQMEKMFQRMSEGRKKGG